jgi:hypothetical protein
MRAAEIIKSEIEIMVVSGFLEAADWETGKYGEL